MSRPTLSSTYTDTRATESASTASEEKNSWRDANTPRLEGGKGGGRRGGGGGGIGSDCGARIRLGFI